MKKYPLAKPSISSQDKKRVMAVLSSGKLSLGPVYQEFEKKFAKTIGTKYACAVSSGTAGLHLAMIAAGIKEGDEVITSPFSFIASANCILYVKAKPVFVDIDPVSYNIDPAKIEAKITKKTKAILVVHIFGQSADMDPIIKIAKKYKLKIIEDACESINATYRGKKVGTFGESAVFAFYPNKQMTTGEGGMITTNSKEVYELCCCLRNQGRTENMQWLDHKVLGYNYRLDEMSAALGLSQISRIDKMIKSRKAVAELYNRILSAHQLLVQIPETKKYNSHTWFVYVLKIRDKAISRDRVIKDLAARGIASKPYLPSIHLFDFYKKMFHYKEYDFVISEDMSNHSLALPFYLGLKKADIKYIVNNLIEILNNYEK
ncbi:MAG: DegT/DnrJ/EryC1/StrS family aminotransferase [Candidatus Buchananbacteria bacterium]